MVRENHWFCVHINLETGYELYADSIANSFSKTHLATFFKEYAKHTKINMTLLNPCKFLMKFNQQEASTNVEIFMWKNIYQRNDMIVCGAAAISSAIVMSDFTLTTDINRKGKLTRYYAWINDLETYSSSARKDWSNIILKGNLS